MENIDKNNKREVEKFYYDIKVTHQMFKLEEILEADSNLFTHIISVPRGKVI